MNYKINIGWFVWNGAERKYVQVKLRTGGGSRELDIPGETNYTSLLEMGKDLFFPYGKYTFVETKPMIILASLGWCGCDL